MNKIVVDLTYCEEHGVIDLDDGNKRCVFKLTEEDKQSRLFLYIKRYLDACEENGQEPS